MKIEFDLSPLSDWGVGFLEDVSRRCKDDCEALHAPLLAAMIAERNRRDRGDASLSSIEIPGDTLTLAEVEECGLEARAICDYLVGLNPPADQESDRRRMAVLYGLIVHALGRVHERLSRARVH